MFKEITKKIIIFILLIAYIVLGLYFSYLGRVQGLTIIEEIVNTITIVILWPALVPMKILSEFLNTSITYVDTMINLCERVQGILNKLT